VVREALQLRAWCYCTPSIHIAWCIRLVGLEYLTHGMEIEYGLDIVIDITLTAVSCKTIDKIYCGRRWACTRSVAIIYNAQPPNRLKETDKTGHRDILGHLAFILVHVVQEPFARARAV